MLAADEEIDYLEYQGYLRSQSNTDLCDILSHLDYARCPRRAEAARRELHRRSIVKLHSYADSENMWRKFLMLVIAVICATILLGLTMSVDEARKPQPPPSLDLYTDGDSVEFLESPLSGGSQMTVAILGVYTAQLCENALRDFVYYFARSGGYSLLLFITLWKAFASSRAHRIDDPLTDDIRRLLLIAISIQLLLISSAAWNNLSVLSSDGNMDQNDFADRAVTFLMPWFKNLV